jgi:hypothetical protein
MLFGNGWLATASSGHRTTIVVDPGVIRQSALPMRYKLTNNEEGECQLRCERTFLHICRVCCEVVEDTNYLIAFLNPGFILKKKLLLFFFKNWQAGQKKLYL